MGFREIIPPEAGAAQPRVIICGREEVLIEGHGGLFSYETKQVRVRSRAGLWTVTGAGLVIDHFGADDMVIRGRVDSVAVNGEG